MKKICVLFLTVAVMAGCHSNWIALPKASEEPDKQAGEKAEDKKAGLSEVLDRFLKDGGKVSDEYKIGPGDILEISVYGEESLNRKDLVVKPDGRVSYPLVGDVQVGGLTTVQAKEALEQSLHDFIPGAVAAVSVTQLGSLQYYVVGKVNKPGMYNVSKPLTVLQALAMAGGLTPYAKESDIIILRNSGKETVQLPFDYKSIKKGKNVEENIILERGDVVLVP